MNIRIPISSETLTQVKYIKEFAFEQLYLEVYKQFPKELFAFQNLKWEMDYEASTVNLSAELVFPHQHEWTF